LLKRENAIGEGFSVFNCKLSNAFEKRKSDLYVAWGKSTTSERKAGQDNAWYNNYMRSMQSTQIEFRDARLKAWRTYESDMKKCNAPSQTENKYMEIDFIDED
jgi:hypothetical protein